MGRATTTFITGGVRTIGRGHGTTIIHAEDPSLVLDLQFARDQAFVSRRGPLPTFTRASAGTFVGSNGLIQSAALNVPRIDFDPTNLACRGLLLEEQRTNTCIHSENLSAANWGKSNVSVTTDSATAPTGLLTADLLSETAVSGYHTISIPSITPAAGTTYSISAFFKKGPGATAPDWLILGLGTQFPASIVAFNVTTGAFGAVTGSSFTYRAVAYPNGWWRVVLVVTASGSSAASPLTVYFSNNTNTVSAPSYLGQTASNVLIWGAQVEAGAFATSYIPTTSAAVVRSADVCSITGASFTSFFNATKGTLVFRGIKSSIVSVASSQINYISLNDGTLSNYLLFAQRATGTTGEVFRCESGGASQALISGGSLVSAFTSFGLAARYKANDFAVSLDGGAAVTDTSGSVPGTVSQLQFLSTINSLWVDSLQYYNRTKTNSQLQALSTP